jgi:protein-tyrosine-phosphatase
MIVLVKGSSRTHFEAVKTHWASSRTVLAVMQESGIDLSHAKPQKLTEDLAKEVQLLITMRCGDKCPQVPGLCVSMRDPR